MYLLLLTLMEDPCVCIISQANAFSDKNHSKSAFEKVHGFGIHAWLVGFMVAVLLVTAIIG